MDINIDELKQKLDNKEEFIFIDVREPHEYEEFNLGAKLCPLGDIMNVITEFEGWDLTVALFHEWDVIKA